jgi:predicted small lipoprotein YifL
MMKRGKTLLTSLAMILLTLGLSACEQEGPAERAGEKVDAAAERAKEAVDPKGSAERAGEKADEAMERAGEATEERTQQ